MFGREEFRPIIDGIPIGLQVLLVLIGALTLGIGGVGVMNIMLFPSMSGSGKSACGAPWARTSRLDPAALRYE